MSTGEACYWDMEKGPASVRNVMYNSRASLLPPKIPAIGQSYTEYVPSSVYGSRNNEKGREWNSHHQRTSSESLLIEEQPSWLDELLDEPETPVRKVGHRRSSSDSFAYTDAASVVNMGGYLTKNDNQFRNITPFPSWGSQDFDHFSKVHHASFGVDPNPVGKHKNWAWDAPVNSVSRTRGFSSPSNIVQSSGSAPPLQRADGNSSLASEGKDAVESASHESKGSVEKKDSSHGKLSSSETDTKRAKQQFAQRSRVRKLQYIAELERNVQALQGETSEASAQLEFIHQQNLILGMENKALKQRLESLAQEQLIKYLEQEVLEREVARLRALYQQQQQQQQPPQRSGHLRNSSRDLDQQLADLSLKSKDNNPARDPVF